MVQLLRDYLDACALVDRAVAEKGVWGPEAELGSEEKAFLDAAIEIAVERLHAVRAELAAGMDREFRPSYEWKPRQGSPYYTVIDPAQRQQLVQEVADLEGRRTVVKSESGALEAAATPSAPRTRLVLAKAFGSSERTVRQPIGFGKR